MLELNSFKKDQIYEEIDNYMNADFLNRNLSWLAKKISTNEIQMNGSVRNITHHVHVSHVYFAKI